MIAIIAEKPSVGQEIARVVGATEKKDGYITGNGYMVTWALGHLVSLALPGTYGYTRNHRRRPSDASRTVPSCGTTDTYGQGHGDGHRRRQRQLKVIDGVFSECDSIIVATDAGARGNSSSGGYIPTWAVPSFSNACGSPRLPMRPSERGWQTSGKDMNTTASMRPRTAGRRRTGWWA